ncbi:hypothetical protein SCHPADRAFT_831852, partial [Schizopora paradoxa]
RCLDCVPSQHFCEKCIALQHHSNLTHRLQKWCFVEWNDVTFATIGVDKKLGHDGDQCPLAGDLVFELQLLHTTGFRPIRVVPCACPGFVVYQEFLRLRWMPISLSSLNYAVTFDVIEGYLRRNYTSHVSTYDYLKEVSVDAPDGLYVSH